jgi:hypothetical protein
MNYSKDKVQQALRELATELEEQQNKLVPAKVIAKKVRTIATELEREHNSLFAHIKPIESFDKNLDLLMDKLGMDFDKICKD